MGAAREREFHAHYCLHGRRRLGCLIRIGNGPGETDSAVDAVVIGHRKSGEPKLLAPGGHLLRVRRAIEKREVGVRV